MVLKNLDLYDYFDFIADATKCKNSKPDTRNIYNGSKWARCKTI